MRQVPHPIAVITSTDVAVDPEGAPSAFRGATVNSFNTVTVDPHPIVSFNIKKLSATRTAIENSGLFHVHLFAATERAAELAHRFTRGNEPSLFHTEQGAVEEFVVGKLLSGPRQEKSFNMWRKPPTIRVGKFRQLQCELLSDKTVEIEDHVVLFGKVLRVGGGKLPAGQPLLSYVNGAYSGSQSETKTPQPHFFHWIPPKAASRSAQDWRVKVGANSKKKKRLAEQRPQNPDSQEGVDTPT